MQKRFADVRSATFVKCRIFDKIWRDKEAEIRWPDGSWVCVRFRCDNDRGVWNWGGHASWLKDPRGAPHPHLRDAHEWFSAVVAEEGERVRAAYLSGFSSPNIKKRCAETARHFGITEDALCGAAQVWADRHYLSAVMRCVAHPTGKLLAEVRSEIVDRYGVEPFVEVDEEYLDYLTDAEYEELKNTPPKSNADEALEILVRQLEGIKRQPWAHFAQEVDQQLYLRAISIAEARAHETLV